MGLQDRYEELNGLLSDPSIVEEQSRFLALSKEYVDLGPVVAEFRIFEEAMHALAVAEELRKESDPDIRNLADEEWKEVKVQLEQIEARLHRLLLPQDPNDCCNVFLEIRAGTGGDEAALFAGSLFRMYSRFSEKQRWQMELISESSSEKGGYKEVIARVMGQGVYGKLKFESGVHRVQRIPTTESQGRVHTSTCTVAILPEIEEIHSVEIAESDLQIDTFRASGAGGQHVNRTDSAVRIKHLPTGIVVKCQDERSQHKNKARAMALLKAKLLVSEQSRQRQETAEARRNLVGSGDRSERIRTYNFPQGRLTDHRIGVTLYKLPDIMEGELLSIIEPLIHEHQADLYAEMSEHSD